MATMSATMKQFTKGLNTTFEPMRVSLANIEQSLVVQAQETSREDEVETKRLEKKKLDEETKQTSWLKKLFGKKDEKGEGGGFITRHWGKILTALAGLLLFLPKDFLKEKLFNPDWWKKDVAPWIIGGLLVKTAWENMGSIFAAAVLTKWTGSAFFKTLKFFKTKMFPTKPVHQVNAHPESQHFKNRHKNFGKEQQIRQVTEPHPNPHKATKPINVNKAKDIQDINKIEQQTKKVTKNLENKAKQIANTSPPKGTGKPYISGLAKFFNRALLPGIVIDEFMGQRYGFRTNVLENIFTGFTTDTPLLQTGLKKKSVKKSIEATTIELMRFFADFSSNKTSEHATRDKDGTIVYGAMGDDQPGHFQRRMRKLLGHTGTESPYTLPEDMKTPFLKKFSEGVFGEGSGNISMEKARKLNSSLNNYLKKQSGAKQKKGNDGMTIIDESRSRGGSNLSWKSDLPETSKKLTKNTLAKLEILADYLGGMTITSGRRTDREQWQALFMAEDLDGPLPSPRKNQLTAAGLRGSKKLTTERVLAIEELLKGPRPYKSFHQAGMAFDFRYRRGLATTQDEKVELQKKILKLFPKARLAMEPDHVHMRFDPNIKPEDIMTKFVQLQQEQFARNNLPAGMVSPTVINSPTNNVVKQGNKTVVAGSNNAQHWSLWNDITSIFR